MNHNTLELDRANFPMIWVESLQAYLHWIPVTKIQFEYFLWESSFSRLDQEWLDRVYKLNPRVTPKKIGKGNYWRAFLTGVAPVEAEQYATWCGEAADGLQYSLPTAEEWQKAYREMQGRPCHPLEQDQAAWGRLSDRVQTLLTQLRLSLSAPKHLADQMLFDGGVLEWVSTAAHADADSGWGGYGQTNRSFEFTGMYLNRLFPVKSVPKGPDDNAGRAPYNGFRLLRRERA
ncbi:MAG: hypothetical protein FJ387_15550 [Verrucomicrobia bacterium]|nr:hypothetical protein [Verrucomicrobiota bacterium]